MKIAITGASGFLGYHLIQKLLEQGHDIRAIALNATTAPSLKKFNIEKFDLDVRDSRGHHELFEGQDVVYHLAAKIAISNHCEEELMAINVEGSKAVAQAALDAGVKRFIYVSSVHALSRYPLHECVDETRELALDDHFDYDRSKARAELAMREFAKKGLNIVIVNLTGLFGPHDFEPSLMGASLIGMINSQRAFIVCNGGFNFLDVRDAAETLARMIEKGDVGESYILGGEWYHSREIGQTLACLSGHGARMFMLPLCVAKITLPLNRLIWRLLGQPDMYTEQSIVHLKSHRFISDKKARTALDHRSRPLWETMRDMVDWLR
ncbi:MAG: NAD-dependent epimerase/dehydratase family protein [Gammaproteobacteria bacterium]